MISNKQLLTEYDILRNNIKHYRNLRGLTQEQLAEKSDLSCSYIKQIESSKLYKNISFNTLLKIAKTLGITIQELFTKLN